MCYTLLRDLFKHLALATWLGVICVKSYMPEFDKKTIGFREIHSNTPVLECAALCSESAWCKSFDVETTSLNCYLYADDKDDDENGDTTNNILEFFHSTTDEWQKLSGNCIEIILHRRDRQPARENSVERKGPSSCADVKQCGGIHKDDEYWLYPSILEGSKVKVYCFGMNSTKPEEYITLVKKNYGNVPPECRLNCKEETTVGCPAKLKPGYVEFMKIKINILTLLVNRADKRFASGNGTLVDYGFAADCYNAIYTGVVPEDRSCGPKGVFQIDVSRTGFKFSAEMTWNTDGWKVGMLITRSADNTVITGICGGWCAQCAPTEMRLELNPHDRPWELILSQAYAGRSAKITLETDQYTTRFQCDFSLRSS